MLTIMADDTNTGKPGRYSSVGDNSAEACLTGDCSMSDSRVGDDRTGRNTKRLFVPPQLSHEADFVGVTASTINYS